jgi:hypothetical protein
LDKFGEIKFTNIYEKLRCDGGIGGDHTRVSRPQIFNSDTPYERENRYVQTWDQGGSAFEA